jgi:hypothetical protein
MSSVRPRGLRRAPALLIAMLPACGGSGGGYSSGTSTMYSPMPTAAFSAPSAAASIRLGQALALSWTSTNATTCMASVSAAAGGSFSGMVPISGTQMVAPSAMGTYTYSLQCSGAGGTASAHSGTVTVGASILSELSAITVIGATPDPVEKGGNPYGLALAPVTAGLMTQGDLIICNFNDGRTNTQGAGTTITGLHPSAGAMPYSIANSPSLEGCNALALLADGSISAAAYTANLNPLVTTAGAVTSPFAAHTFANPWGEAFVAATATEPAALYVSNAGDGSIERISLSGDAASGFTEVISGFCVSGSPGAIFAPAGLTYDPSVDTLYVVDTSSYSVVAFTGISSFGANAVSVEGQCTTTTPTPALTFSGPSAAAARVIAHGGQFNAPLSATLLSDGDLLIANADINNPAVPNLVFEVSPHIGFVGQPLQLDNGAAGALFGIVATLDAQGHDVIYFNDDNSNTVNRLSE